MTKTVFTLTTEIYNTYKTRNNGDTCEILDKFFKGYNPTKDANTSYKNGSDIQETLTSVKSLNFSLSQEKELLTTEKNENTRQQIIKTYLQNTHSTNVDYCVIDIENNQFIVYNMDMVTFELFMLNLCTLDRLSGKQEYKLRLKKSENTVRKFLENIL